MFDTIRTDLRDAMRSLRLDRSVALLAVTIVGLGIGASTTVFSLCQALLLRPLPFHAPERLVWIANGTSENLSEQTVQVSNLQSLAQENRTFDGIAGFSPFYGSGDVRLTGYGDAVRITAVPVTQSLFALLGVSPRHGRFFDDAESRFGAPRTAILGYRFFQSRFRGDPSVVGRSITLDDSAVTVIGVLPATFAFGEIFTPGREADVFVPYPLSPETNRRGNTLALIGRLKPDADIAAAQLDAASIANRIRGGRVGDTPRNDLQPRLVPIRKQVIGRFTPALLALAGAVAFLMLLVCANLSNLLLVRAAARRRDLAIRAVLGAPKGRLIRQTVAESMALCAGGAALGMAIAILATRLVSRLQGTTIPLLSDVRVDFAVFAFCAALTAVAGMVLGILPAIQATRFADPLALADSGRGSTAWRGSRLRRAVVVAEIATACVLLTGAGLLIRSLGRVLDVSPGFVTENVVALRVDPIRGQRTSAERRAYLDELVHATRGTPGVAAAGLTDALPLGDNFGWRRWNVRIAERPREATRHIEPLVRMVDAGYFGAMQISLQAGRGFTDTDRPGSEPVVIVNDKLAEALWPGQNAVGRMMNTGGSDRRVVGVVNGVRYFGLDRAVEPEMYMPIGHPGGFSSVDLVVRGSVAQSTLIADVRASLRRTDAALPVDNFRTMKGLVDHATFSRRFVVLLVGGFAVFGLLLSTLGLYAVVSYAVSQRTREIGIRIALGATPAAVRAAIFGETGRLAVLGMSIGLPLSWMLSSAIRGLLYGIEPSDPTTFAATLVALGAVALIAGYLPARRAIRVDPATAVRSQT